MPCRWVTLPDGTRALVKFAAERKTRCATPGCTAWHTKLCDFPVGSGTCDAKMCDRHAYNVGPDKDFCHAHFTMPSPATPWDGPNEDWT